MANSDDMKIDASPTKDFFISVVPINQSARPSVQ
jgi:hypothetical protein